MTVYKGIYFDNYQLDDIAQRLVGRVYVSRDELDQFYALLLKFTIRSSIVAQVKNFLTL